MWFVAKDVCNILGIQNHRDAISELDDDEVLRDVGIGDSSKLRSDGSVPTLISEPGLYALVFKSRKPEAKAFARWVRHDLLPQVMHTGSYTAGTKRSPKSFYAAERIIEKAFTCKMEADCQQVYALDKVFQDTYGRSCLEIAEIQPQVQPEEEPKIRNSREEELWQHIVSTFAPDEWFSTSTLQQTLNGETVSRRQIQRYLADFVERQMLNRHGYNRHSRYTRRH